MRKRIVKLLFVTCLLLIIPLCFWYLPVLQTGLKTVVAWRDQPCASLWFLLIAVICSSLGLPRQAICFAAGLAFGVWEGSVIAMLASQIGASVIYGCTRLLSSAFRAKASRAPKEHEAHHLLSLSALARRAGASRLGQHMQGLIEHGPFRAVLMLRLMPVGSAWLLSAGSGMLHVGFGAFFLATLLGSLPQTLVFVLAGAGGQKDHYDELVWAVILFLLSGFLGVHLLRSYRQMGRKENILERAGAEKAAEKKVEAGQA